MIYDAIGCISPPLCVLINSFGELSPWECMRLILRDPVTITLAQFPTMLLCVRLHEENKANTAPLVRFFILRTDVQDVRNSEMTGFDFEDYGPEEFLNFMSADRRYADDPLALSRVQPSRSMQPDSPWRDGRVQHFLQALRKNLRQRYWQEMD